jgi:hypothetical protein
MHAHATHGAVPRNSGTTKRCCSGNSSNGAGTSGSGCGSVPSGSGGGGGGGPAGGGSGGGSSGGDSGEGSSGRGCGSGCGCPPPPGCGGPSPAPAPSFAAGGASELPPPSTPGHGGCSHSTRNQQSSSSNTTGTRRRKRPMPGRPARATTSAGSAGNRPITSRPSHDTIAPSAAAARRCSSQVASSSPRSAMPGEGSARRSSAASATVRARTAATSAHSATTTHTTAPTGTRAPGANHRARMAGTASSRNVRSPVARNAPRMCCRRSRAANCSNGPSGATAGPTTVAISCTPPRSCAVGGAKKTAGARATHPCPGQLGRRSAGGIGQRRATRASVDQGRPRARSDDPKAAAMPSRTKPRSRRETAPRTGLQPVTCRAADRRALAAAGPWDRTSASSRRLRTA